MNGLIRQMLGGEKGSAMTEFVIGLPVFVTIFSAMGAMYQFHHGGLEAKGEAYSNLWAEDAQGTLLGVSPVGAFDDIGSIGDVWQNGLSGAGIYVDSGIKTQIPARLMPGSGVDPSLQLSGITGGNDTYVNYRLLNDFYDPTWNGSSFAGAFSSIIRTSGSGLGIGAGVRYGASQGSGTASVSTLWGSVNYDSGEIDLPARTASTHRIAPVILSRMEFSLTERFDESIPVFEVNPNLSSEQLEEGDSCQTQARAYQRCIQSGVDSGRSNRAAARGCRRQKPSGECESLAGSGGAGNFDMSWCGALGGC